MRKASQIAAALFTAVATLAAGFGMSATANAETPTGTATIELNTNSNVDLTKTTFVAYPLMYLTGQPQADSEDTLASVAASPVSAELTADLKAALTAEDVTIAPGSTPEATFLALKSTDQAKIDTLTIGEDNTQLLLLLADKKLRRAVPIDLHLTLPPSNPDETITLMTRIKAGIPADLPESGYDMGFAISRAPLGFWYNSPRHRIEILSGK